MSIELDKDYQDQGTWYEIQCATAYQWITIADDETRFQAEELLAEIMSDDSSHEEHEHRIKRVRGIDEMDCS